MNQTIGTKFAGTPPWPLVARTGSYWGFIEPEPLPEDPNRRKTLDGYHGATADYIKQWPGSTAADVWRGLDLKRRDDAMRFITNLVRWGYLRWEQDYHEITSLPIRRYYYIED